MKPFLIILGFVSAALIIAQLTIGQLIVASHDPRLIKTHQHTGYLTVVVALLYILVSLPASAPPPPTAVARRAHALRRRTCRARSGRDGRAAPAGRPAPKDGLLSGRGRGRDCRKGGWPRRPRGGRSASRPKGPGPRPDRPG